MVLGTLIGVRASYMAKRRRRTLRKMLKKRKRERDDARNRWARLTSDQSSSCKWALAQQEKSRTAVIIFVLYLCVFLTVAFLDGTREVADLFYFWATTVTTVGFGDISFNHQRSRLAAIVLLPAGLVVVGFSISFLQTKLSEFATKSAQRYADKMELWMSLFDDDGSGHVDFVEFKRGIRKKVTLANFCPEFVLESWYDAMLEFEGDPFSVEDDKLLLSTAQQWDGELSRAQAAERKVALKALFPRRSLDILDLRIAHLCDPHHSSHRRVHETAAAPSPVLVLSVNAAGEEEEEEEDYEDAMEDKPSFFDSLAWRVLLMLLQFSAVVGLGVVFLMCYDAELEKQDEAAESSSFTLVDAFFFSVVICTTVGYGHRIVPLTDGCKLFLVAYMFVGTATLAHIIDSLSDLYMCIASERVASVVKQSSLFLYQADICDDGEVTESDYLLFKLRELLEVNEPTVRQIQSRFKVLSDKEPKGWVKVGQDVPSAAQVKKLEQLQNDDPQKSLQQLWEDMCQDGKQTTFMSEEERTLLKAKEEERKSKLRRKNSLKDIRRAAKKRRSTRRHSHHRRRRASSLYTDEIDEETISDATAMSVDHTRELWAGEARTLFWLVLALVLVYMALGYLVLASDMALFPSWDRVYFLSATISTVGYGDYAPTSQFPRAAAIVLIPAGLAILGLLLSYARARALATPPKGSTTPEPWAHAQSRIEELDAVFGNGDGSLDRKELNEQFTKSLRYSFSRMMCCNDEDAVPWNEKITISSFLWYTWDIYLFGCIFGSAFTRGDDLESLDDEETLKAAVDTTNKNNGEDFSFFSRVYYDVIDTYPRVVKILRLFLTLAAVAGVGAAFFKLVGKENDVLELTWIDAFYFAVVTCSSIGYGDITPQTRLGKGFSIFYLLASTVIVASVLGEIVELYVSDTVDAKVVDDIINTDIYIYMCDIKGDMHISESDFILFKMHQLGLVDRELKEQLMDQFEALDFCCSGSLAIGFEIPDENQVKELQEELRGKVRAKLEKEKRSPLGFAMQTFNDYETTLLLMRLWKIKKEKHADRISEKFGIKQEHKKQKLKLEEMSSKSVNEIYKKWKQERKEASTAKGTGNLKLRLRSKDEATSKLPSTTKKSSSFELPRTRSLGSSL